MNKREKGEKGESKSKSDQSCFSKYPGLMSRAFCDGERGGGSHGPKNEDFKNFDKKFSYGFAGRGWTDPSCVGQQNWEKNTNILNQDSFKLKSRLFWFKIEKL